MVSYSDRFELEEEELGQIEEEDKERMEERDREVNEGRGRRGRKHHRHRDREGREEDREGRHRGREGRRPRDRDLMEVIEDDIQQEPHRRQKRKAIRGTTQRWTNNVIPYYIQGGFSECYFL